jgi:hypothetical protein
VRGITVEVEAPQPAPCEPPPEVDRVGRGEAKIEDDEFVPAIEAVPLGAQQHLAERSVEPAIGGGYDNRCGRGRGHARVFYYAMSDAGPVRVAIRISRDDAREWQRRAVDAIRSVPGARVVLAIVAGGDAARPGDARLDPGLTRVPLARVVGDAPQLREDADPDVRSYAPDVIVDFAGAGAAPPSAGAPRLGVWRFGFGDGSASADGAAGTLARLYRAGADPASGVVLHEGWYRSGTVHASGTKALSLRVAPWCARALRQITWGHHDVVTGPARRVSDTPEALPPVAAPSWRAWAAEFVHDRLKRERWTVGLVPAGIAEILQRARLPDPVWLVGQPRDRFYADPFPLRRDGDRVHVLVEDYRYRERRGRVTELEVGPGGELLAARDRLTPAHHVSYPFLLRDGARLVCVPEAARAGRAVTFDYDPDRDVWRPGGTLLDGVAAVDPTLVRHEGRWWLFCTRWNDADQTDLHVFSASDWRGPWEPHPLNPVKSDARSSRPAGAFFEVDGALYRPAQNCARRYGAALCINRVVELSARRFREEPVAALTPSPASPWPSGLHTINSVDGLTVVDGLRVERGLADPPRVPRAGPERA